VDAGLEALEFRLMVFGVQDRLAVAVAVTVAFGRPEGL
jgi:hypothetical protein